MMRGKIIFTSFQRRIEDDHAGIREEAAALRALADDQQRGDVAWWADMEKSLGAFRENLLGHFEREESADIQDELQRGRPQFARAYGELLGEHKVLLQALNDLAALLDQRSSRADVAARMRSFLEKLAAHERAETALFQDAWLQDDGGHG